MRLVGKAPGDVRFEPAVPVPGEGGVIPDRGVDRQPDALAEQQLVVDLVDQQALGSPAAAAVPARASPATRS